jgi:hypothetical protein
VVRLIRRTVRPQRTPEGTPPVLSRLRPRWLTFLSSL